MPALGRQPELEADVDAARVELLAELRAIGSGSSRRRSSEAEGFEQGGVGKYGLVLGGHLAAPTASAQARAGAGLRTAASARAFSPANGLAEGEFAVEPALADEHERVPPPSRELTRKLAT
jgi:hypothetical protein